MAKISILMPSYNKHEYILDGIKSIINQTHKDIEFFIVDNSTDNGVTRKTIEDYLKTLDKETLDKIIYITPDFSQVVRNKFYIPALIINMIYPIMSGKYIFYISDDDTVTNNALKVMHDYLEASPNKACYIKLSRIKETNENGIKKWVDFPILLPHGKTFNVSALPDCQLDGGQVLHEREILFNFPSLEFMPQLKNPHNCHADGLFLSNLCRVTPIVVCPNSDSEIIYHRITLKSTWARA